MEFYSKLEKHDRSSLPDRCKNFYVINSISSCKLDSNLFSSPPQVLHSFDHVLNPNKNTLIAYLDIADQKLAKISSEIKKFCKENNSAYIFRHIDLRSDRVDYLGGYGAELLAKNMKFGKNDLEISQKEESPESSDDGIF